MISAALFLLGFFDFLPHLPDFFLCRLCKLCQFVFKLADIAEIYPDMLNSLFCPFLIALMHFNSADKFIENGGGKVGKGGVAFYQLQKLMRPSSCVLKRG